jgi:hypothetical protein
MTSHCVKHNLVADILVIGTALPHPIAGADVSNHFKTPTHVVLTSDIKHSTPKVVVEWLASPLRIPEVPSCILGPLVFLGPSRQSLLGLLTL